MNKPALLVMDVQNGIVDRFQDNPEPLRAVQKSVEAARKYNIPVVFIRVAFSAGYPEISPSNKAFAQIARFGGMTVEDHGTQIHDSVRPMNGEAVVTKYRVSAFAGSNLEVILRAQQIGTLVLTGIATSGVVLSTLREAADKDFAIQVLADACADQDPEVHRLLVEKVFPRQAEVLTVDDWIVELSSTRIQETD